MFSPKLNDRVIYGLTKVGISQKTMSKMFNCHQTAISSKQKKLNVKVDKEILENVFFNLSFDQKEWLVSKAMKRDYSTILISGLIELFNKETNNE